MYPVKVQPTLEQPCLILLFLLHSWQFIIKEAHRFLNLIFQRTKVYSDKVKIQCFSSLITELQRKVAKPTICTRKNPVTDTFPKKYYFAPSLFVQ